MKIGLLGFFLLMLVGVVSAGFTGNSLGDTSKETVNAIGYDGAGKGLQNIFDTKGYNLDVFDDQKEFQIWETKNDYVKLEIELVEGISAINNTFGYYTNNGNFIPLFSIRANSNFPDVPVFSDGEKVTIVLKDIDEIGFGINGNVFTEISRTTNTKDASVDYQLNDKEFLIGFEDSLGSKSDWDFQDVVVKIKVVKACNDDDNDDENETNGIKVIGNFCEPLYECGDWSECYDGIQTRICEDINHCENDWNKPIETISCEKVLVEETKKANCHWWFWLLIAVGVLLILILIVLGMRG